MPDTAKVVITSQPDSRTPSGQPSPSSLLVANAQLGGATPLWEWIGDDGATVFSY
jgi:hypothetical protein